MPPDSVLEFRTGVPLFAGFVENASPDSSKASEEATSSHVLTRWAQFPELFRELGLQPVRGGFLAYAVRGFFENGGERCVVILIPLKASADAPDSMILSGALKALFSKNASGLRRIPEEIEEADLVCVPDIMMEPIRRSPEIVFDLQRRILEYCREAGDRFAILDALFLGEGKAAPARIEDYTERIIQHRKQLLGAEGAIYSPWIRVVPIAENSHYFVPPCGHMAGIYARTDTEIGVHKAPANEIVEGVLDLEVMLTDEEQKGLNDVGVNCLKSFPRRGIRVWGARTLSAFPQWRYVNVRRVFLTLVRWIEIHMNDLVFEPNNPGLWERVKDRLGTYCYDLFQRGALKGRSPAEAFFVTCDAELNPREARDAGQVICEVGLAALTPAEFIVVRITQNPTGSVTVSSAN